MLSRSANLLPLSVAGLFIVINLACTGDVAPDARTEDGPGPLPTAPSIDTPIAQPSDAEADADSEATQADDTQQTPVGDTSKRGQNLTITLGNGSTTELVDHATTAGPFTLSLTANQSILVRQKGNCTVDGGGTMVGNLDGPRGIGGGIFFRDDCDDARRYTADRAGDVTLTIAKGGHVGFDVIDVTEEAPISIAFGEATHTGAIDFIGDEDVWTLDVTEGQTFVVNERGCTRSDGDGSMFTMKIDGPARGPQGFWRIGQCDGTGRYEVTEDGTVSLRIAGGNTLAGTYAFDVIDVDNGDVIPLTFGSEVRPGIPVADAGRLDPAGERDVYALPVTAGQTVVITQRGGCEFENGNILSMDVKGAGIRYATNFRPSTGGRDCFRVYRLLMEEDDTLMLTVDDTSRQLTGTYTFDISTGAETVEEAEEVLSELDVTPATPETIERTITLDETLLFDFGSADLKPEALLAIAEVADVLGVYKAGQVRIVGHTDSVGSDASNQTLSQRRADAIATALGELGVDSDRLTASGAGETQPVASNDTDEGRAKNRRVDITFRTRAAE